MTAERNELTLAVKLDRLFEVCHKRGEPEQFVDDVAKAVSRIVRRPIPAEAIRGIRNGSLAPADLDIVEGLARHFAVPPEYLTTTGARADHLDQQLRLLAAARDAGVQRLALRGGPDADTEWASKVFQRLAVPND